MKKSLYRIVVSRLAPDAKETFVQFLIRELGYSEDRAQSFVQFLPGMLFESPNGNDIKKLVKKLHAIGVNLTIQKLVRDEHSPVFIETSQQRAISKLLNMTLRAGTDTALVYLVAEPEEGQGRLKPLLGREKKIETNFRLSDFIYAVDDTSILFLGFTTDLKGLGFVVPKLVRTVRCIVGDSARIHIGEAVFPGDGYSFAELIRAAHKKMRDYRLYAERLKAPKSAPDAVTQMEALASEPAGPDGEQEQADYIFKHARGGLFLNLLKLDPETIWFGLKGMATRDQKRFVSRIPYDSQLVHFLAGKIKHQADVKDEKTAYGEIQALVAGFPFREKMAERKRNQAAVLGKLNQIESLPAFPAVAMQVYNISMDPDARIEDIEKLLATDPVLTLKILKLVNSSFYGLPQKVDSVKEGIVILGMDEISQMAFGLSLARTFSQINLNGLVNADVLRRHAVETAMVGKYLCRKRKDLQTTGIFTAGILHDIGKLFLIEQFPALYESVVKTAGKLDLPVCMLEEEVFGFSHGIVGGIIAQKWNLPKTLVQAISYHHYPSFASEHEDLAAIVGFADSLCHQVPDASEQGRREGVAWMNKGLLDVLQIVFEEITMESVAERRGEIQGYLAENQAMVNILNNEQTSDAG